MSAAHDFSRYAQVPEEGPVVSTLTARLDAKLAELTGRGYRILWIEASEKYLVTLFTEGGDDAIVMDSDPDSDLAWYGDFELRPSDKHCVWIYLEGEVQGMSAHVIS